MIDIHSHILYGLDDGARSLQESVEMAGIAARTGTTDIVATPHANFEFRFDPLLIQERVVELQAAVGPAIRIHRGCDFHLSPENIKSVLADPARYTVNGKSYLLVEFPDVLIAKSTSQDFARLLAAGITPIITHPERNFLLHKRLEEIRLWAQAGCLVQVTAQSLTGRFGSEARDFARMLLREGLVHFLASDAHDDTDRTPRLDQAYQHVASRYGGAIAELLCVRNPQAVLEGKPLPKQEQPQQPRRKWYRFWER